MVVSRTFMGLSKPKFAIVKTAPHQRSNYVELIMIGKLLYLLKNIQHSILLKFYFVFLNLLYLLMITLLFR